MLLPFPSAVVFRQSDPPLLEIGLTVRHVIADVQRIKSQEMRDEEMETKVWLCSAC